MQHTIPHQCAKTLNENLFVTNSVAQHLPYYLQDIISM